MILALTLALACISPSDGDVVDSPSEELEWTAPQGGVVTVETRDGVTLEADYLPSETQGFGIVLLHMIPPNNTRADWPDVFKEALNEQGWSVMAVDRRGAGGSGGTATDAYQGEAGKYDVEACVKQLMDDGYEQVAIIGASNGTTSMVDYAVWAEDEGLPVPLGMAYMSGGSYTETQNPMGSVPLVPMAFLYPPNEALWAEGNQDLDPGTWRWHSYENGDHGTRLFTTVDGGQVTHDLLAFTASLRD